MSSSIFGKDSARERQKVSTSLTFKHTDAALECFKQGNGSPSAFRDLRSPHPVKGWVVFSPVCSGRGFVLVPCTVFISHLHSRRMGKYGVTIARPGQGTAQRKRIRIGCGTLVFVLDLGYTQTEIEHILEGTRTKKSILRTDSVDRRVHTKRQRILIRQTWQKVPGDCPIEQHSAFAFLQVGILRQIDGDGNAPILEFSPRSRSALAARCERMTANPELMRPD